MSGVHQRLKREIDDRIKRAEQRVNDERLFDERLSRPPTGRGGSDSWQTEVELARLMTLFEIRRVVEWDRLGDTTPRFIPNEEYETDARKAELRLVEQEEGT